MDMPAPRSPERILTHDDHAALWRLLADGAATQPGGDDVQRALLGGKRVDARPPAPGLVTMNAQVFLVTEREDQMIRLTLCFPGEADPARGRISVLSPLGASLLGMCAGQTVSWRSFGRVHAARILAVLAPLQRAGGPAA